MGSVVRVAADRRRSPGREPAADRLGEGPARVPLERPDARAVDRAVVHVLVDLKDGSLWSATTIPLAQAEVLMKRWAVSGDPAQAGYFWSL